MSYTKPPIKEVAAAIWQWISVLVVYIPLVVLGLFITPLTILASRSMKNHIGELSQKHSEKYLAQGSSGTWVYFGCTVPFLRWFSNLEDGNWGEPSGKHSARWKGWESSFSAQYGWLALRNPVNWLKRTNPFFHCLVDDCDIQYWGDYSVSDKSEHSGWQFVKATHKVTGKSYYGFYSVKNLGDGYCRQQRYGFKINPNHANETQDIDDKDKAFTFRLQLKSKIN